MVSFKNIFLLAPLALPAVQAQFHDSYSQLEAMQTRDIGDEFESHRVYARDAGSMDNHQFFSRREVVHLVHAALQRRAKNAAKCSKCESDCNTMAHHTNQVSENYHKCYQANCLKSGICR